MRDYEELVDRLRAGTYTAEELSIILPKAADAIEELSMKLHGDEAAIAGMKREIERMVVSGNKPRWIPVTERLPDGGVHVLVCCRAKWLAGSGNIYVCDAFRSNPKTIVCSCDDDIDSEYDEETDEYYFPEGWWEVIKNWDDYSCVAIEDVVTHWMPLPEPPGGES